MPKNCLGELRVYSERCEECLFSPNAVVDDERRKEILEGLQASGKWFSCHLATQCGLETCCRGFYDANAAHHSILQIAGRLGVLRFISTPTLREVACRMARRCEAAVRLRRRGVSGE